MSVLSMFARQKNKNAIVQPEQITDFSSPSVPLIVGDSTSFACMDKIATSFADLNYSIYDVKTRQKVNHDFVKVLKQPNMEDRHFNFFYQSAIDYFNGGCYWLKVKVNGVVVSLFRLNASQIVVKRNDMTNEKNYYYNGKIYTPSEIIYVPSRFSYSTLRGGQSIFSAVAGAFKTSRDLDCYTQASFTNGMGKRLIIDVQGAFPRITTEQATEIKNGFVAEYGGAQNAGKPILKKSGFEYSEIGNGTDNQKAELSENRKFQEHEISKIFGIPESILKPTENTTLENAFTLYNEFAIKPLATQFQEAINSMLDEERFYFEFDYNGIMKVSLQQRIDAYTKQINNGLLSPNEARAKENLSPIEAGDNHFMPVNLMPLNDETINAYMAKQKNEINGTKGTDPTDENTQHFGGGDDKQ